MHVTLSGTSSAAPCSPAVERMTASMMGRARSTDPLYRSAIRAVSSAAEFGVISVAWA